VVNYARAGRGASGDHAAYTVARELEDLAAVAALVAEPVHVVGVSSGGMFALEAALTTVPLGRIAVYDVPYDTGPDAGPRYDHYRSELAAALAADRRGDAVALFMTLAGVPADEVDQARGSTAWPAVERLAHTLAYDAELYGPPPLDRFTAITCPTLVLTSGAGTFYETAADAVADAIPGALRMRLPDQGHVADPSVLAATLRAFFREE
jgi:pimeloyl-ACP methyl ester carboxylesterase